MSGLQPEIEIILLCGSLSNLEVEESFMKKWKCTVCGYTHEGETAPESCPVCKVGSDKFEELIEKSEKNDAGSVPPQSRKWKCKLCGYEHEGDSPPEKCPLCGAGAEQFEEVTNTDEQSRPAPEKKKSAGGVVKEWKCSVCGYVHEGENPPDKCPLCGVGAEKFVEVGKEPAAPAEVKKVNSVEKKDRPSFLVSQVLKHHLHPIIVHTPNGVLPVALVFMVLAVLSSNHFLETAAFYNLIFVLFSLPAVLATGVIVWKNRFGGALSSLFKIKIAASAIVTILLAVLVGWRIVEPEVLTGANKWTYILLTLGMVGAVGLAGHLGGKLVFGSRD